MQPNGLASSSAIAGLLSALVILLPTGPTGAAPKGSPWGASYFPNVPLVTQDGKPVRFYEDLVKDKIVVINFISTSCPDACRFLTAKLVQLQELLGDRVGQDIFMYSITIDPARDTPAVLKDYAAKYRIGPGWLFLTGERADIDLLRKKLGQYSGFDPASLNEHTARLIVGNEATDYWMPASPFDNRQYLAAMIGGLLAKWKYTGPGKSTAEATKLRMAQKGERLFQSRCVLCHTVGQGEMYGPDLLGVTGRRDRAWLARWLKAPDRLLAERDPVATALFKQYKDTPMPNLHLAESDVEALLTYFEVQDGAWLPAAWTQPAAGR